LESIPGPHKHLKIRAQDDNLIPTQFLAPIDCLKIPAQYSQIRWSEEFGFAFNARNKDIYEGGVYGNF
jgi:hypothetical protein